MMATFSMEMVAVVGAKLKQDGTARFTVRLKTKATAKSSPMGTAIVAME